MNLEKASQLSHAQWREMASELKSRLVSAEPATLANSVPHTEDLQ